VTDEEFEEVVMEALESLPPELAARLENVAVLVADEAPGHPTRLGYYEGVPHTRRGTGYAGVLPDRITIYRGTLERLYGSDPERLRERIRHVVLHEVAHHFGISDERLREIGRY
jgi:predicted Zn-dependent protease with MMP-like domain